MAIGESSGKTGAGEQRAAAQHIVAPGTPSFRETVPGCDLSGKTLNEKKESVGSSGSQMESVAHGLVASFWAALLLF